MHKENPAVSIVCESRSMLPGMKRAVIFHSYDSYLEKGKRRDISVFLCYNAESEKINLME